MPARGRQPKNYRGRLLFRKPNYTDTIFNRDFGAKWFGIFDHLIQNFLRHRSGRLFGDAVLGARPQSLTQIDWIDAYFGQAPLVEMAHAHDCFHIGLELPETLDLMFTRDRPAEISVGGFSGPFPSSLTRLHILAKRHDGVLKDEIGGAIENRLALIDFDAFDGVHALGH